MFIRSVTKSVKGKKYTQHQLIESIRTPSGPRQRLILNLGQLSISKEQFKSLANRIEEIITDQSSLFPCPDEIEALARHFGDQIIHKGLKPVSSLKKNQTDFANVDLNSLTHSSARSLGAEHVAFETIKQLQLPVILKSLSFEDSQITYALMLIIGRMVCPSSERETVNYIKSRSSLPELLNSQISVYDNALHRVAIKLSENRDAIEQALSKKTHDLFDLDETIFLYDLTNTYFEGSKSKSKVAGFNRSKDRRGDRPLVTLALVVDQMGFPKQSRILKGACVEIETIPNLLDQLQNPSMNWLSEKKTIVIDAGMASEENLQLITDRGFHYVAVSRKRTYPDHFWDSASQQEIPLSDEKNSLTVRLIKTETEAFLHCKSPHKLIKEQNILNRRQQKFEAAVALLNKNFSKKRTLKRYDKVLEKVGRLKQQYRVGHRYSIDIQHKDNLCTRIDLQRKESSIQKPPGEYVLRTDRLDLSAEQISKIHRSLTTIEDSFCAMKGHLGLRPNFHHNDDPTLAHIFITVLAYHILAVILAKLRDQGIHFNWQTIRSILSTHIRLTTSLLTDQQKTIHIRGNTRPDQQQTTLYSALNLAHNPIGQIKSTHSLLNKCSDENLPSKNLTC